MFPEFAQPGVFEIFAKLKLNYFNLVVYTLYEKIQIEHQSQHIKVLG